MDEDKFDGEANKVDFNQRDPAPEKTTLSKMQVVTNRPRLLVIGPGPDQIGGVPTFIQILVSSPIIADKYEAIRLDTTRAPDDRGVEGHFSLLNLQYFFRQTIQLIRIARKQKPFLMHLPVTSGLSIWKATAQILIGKSLGIKVVAHLHGGMFDQYYRATSKQIQRLIGWAFSKADIVIALSKRWKHFLVDEVRPDLQVDIVHNTVDKVFAEAAKQDPNNLDRAKNEVLFVGGLGQRKGVFDILKAIPIVRSACPDVVFMFAGGEAARGDRDEIDRRCEEADLNGVVRFLGPVTGPAKLQLFQKATLFILPSHGENLPYALLEAMAVGLPVVTTPVGAIPEIVVDGRHGFLIQPGDYKSLAKCIIQLLDDEPLRGHMSLANSSLIQQFYLPEVAMSKFVAIYDRLQGIDHVDITLSSRDIEKGGSESLQGAPPTSSCLHTRNEHKEKSHAKNI